MMIARSRTLLVVAVLPALLLAACDRAVPSLEKPAQPVRIMNVSERALDTRIVATGLVRAGIEAPLAFKTPGIIAEMKVDAGDSVKSGQILATLVMTDLDAQLTQARENLAKAERDLARAEALRAKGMISQQAEQDVRAQRAVASSALAAATFNRQQAIITAPAAGVILEKRADARETVAAGQPVVMHGRLDRGWVVRAGLPAREALQIKLGDIARVRLDPDRDQSSALAATVSRIAAASDPRTGTIEVEASLPPAQERRISGMVAHLEFTHHADAQSSKKTVTALPMSAVLEGNQGHARVFVLDASGKTVKRLDVRTGALLDGAIEILEGLPADAKVVSEGAGWLSDGDSVRVLQ